jgi:hypothetical protein
MASLFDNAFGNFLDFDLEGIFDDVFGYGPAGNVIDYFTGFNPGMIGSGPGTQEARRMLEKYEDLEQKPYTYNELQASLPEASLIDQPGAIDAIGYDPGELDYAQYADRPDLDLTGYDAQSIQSQLLGGATGYAPSLYDPTNPLSAAGVSDSDQRARQLQVIGDLQEIYDQEGLTDVDRMTAEQILQGQATEATRGRDAALQNIRERGLEGSGMEAALTAQANQAGSEAARRSGIDIMRGAQTRRDQALRGVGDLATSVRGTDIALSGKNADIINNFNRANADAITAAAMRNAQLQTDAQRYQAEQANLNARINNEVQNQVERINAQYATDAAQYGAEVANRERETNLQNVIQVAEQNTALGNEASLRNYQARQDQAQYLADRQNETTRYNLDNQIETNIRNASIENQVRRDQADIANQFTKLNQENLNKIEQLGNEFSLDKLKGEAGASGNLIKQLNAEQAANELRRTSEELAKKGGSAGTGQAGQPGAGQAGQPGTGVGPSGPGGLYKPGDTVAPGSDLARQLEQGYQRDQGAIPGTGGTPGTYDPWAPGTGIGYDFGVPQTTPDYDFPDYTEDYTFDDEYDFGYDFPDYTEDYTFDNEYDFGYDFPDYTEDYTFDDSGSGYDFGYDFPDYTEDYTFDDQPSYGGDYNFGFDVPGYAGGSYNTGTQDYSYPDYTDDYSDDWGLGWEEPASSNSNYRFDDTFNFFT